MPYADPAKKRMREQARRRSRRKTARRYLSGWGGVPPVAHSVPTAEMFAERDRAYAAQLSIVAAIMGDPPPGRSALDRRSAAP